MQAVVVAVALLVLANCTPTVEPEAGTSTQEVQRPTATTPPPATLAVTRTRAATVGQQAPVTITVSQPTYYTTETVVYTITNRLNEPVFVSLADCEFGGVQRLDGAADIPLQVHFYDPTDFFKRRILPEESLACNWGQEVFQDPAADGAARFLNANPENGRQLPVPPGEYQMWMRYYMTEEEVGQESKGQVAVSPHFTILPAPFREQLVVRLRKREYRLGEPVHYTIRNVGQPREWRGPSYLQGLGCGAIIIERLDGTGGEAWSAPVEQGPLNQIEPYHHRTCTLDPQLWRDAVPDDVSLEPGTYRIRLTYELDDAIVGVDERVRQVFSEPFTVTDVPLPTVAVGVGQLEYALGEPVAITITNGSEETIYTYANRGEPSVWWVNGNEIRPLVMRIDEEWIPARPLPPGESKFLTWDQTAWQDPEQAGRGRFASPVILRPVPPGTYQMRVDYFLTDPGEDLTAERDSALTAVSLPFTISEP